MITKRGILGSVVAPMFISATEPIMVDNGTTPPYVFGLPGAGRFAHHPFYKMGEVVENATGISLNIRVLPGVVP